MISKHKNRLTLDILDMGGKNEFPAMQRIGISNSNAFILVYSVDDPDSFEEVRRLRDLIFEIKLEKHIAKYASTNNLQQLTTNKPDTLTNHQLNGNQQQQPLNSSINPVKKDDLKIDQRRHSLNQINLDLNRHLNHLNNLHNLNDRLNNLNNQLNNQQLHNQTSKRRHHFHHHKHTEKTKKPYILTNINQRYKLSENLKMINERRKSLTNSTKLIDFKSKLGDISETNNDVNQPTADIFCLRPSKLQTTSLPIYEQKLKEQNLLKKDKIVSNLVDVDEEEERQKYTNKGRRRSSFLLSPDSNSSSSSCSDSDSECESSNCDDSCCSSKSSRSPSITNLNDPKLDQQQQNKENNTSFKHVNLNSYKSKLESLKEQQERLQLMDESIPAFDSPVIVIVGNKCDLECKRKIEKDVAENIVQIDWENGFLECSAKNNYNMTAIFKEMLKQSKLPFIVSNALDSQKNRRRSLPAYPSNLAHLKEPTFRTKRNSCALS